MYGSENDGNNMGYTQISMDQLILAAQRGEQPAILFSHAVQGQDQGQIPTEQQDGTQQNITEMNETVEMERRMLQNGSNTHNNTNQ